MKEITADTQRESFIEHLPTRYDYLHRMLRYELFESNSEGRAEEVLLKEQEAYKDRRDEYCKEELKFWDDGGYNE